MSKLDKLRDLFLGRYDDHCCIDCCDIKHSYGYQRGLIIGYAAEDSRLGDDLIVVHLGDPGIGKSYYHWETEDQ